MTVNDLMNLDIEFCEKVSKMGATAWANQFLNEGSMILKLGDTILGEVAIYEHMKPFFQKKGASLVWSPEQGGLSEAEDLGYTYGKYIRQFKNDQDKKVIETGRYMTIWRKQANGNYKLEVNMGN